MAKLNLGVEVRDFDLELMGFSLSVIDETTKRQTSEGYVRMTLQQMGVFLDALHAAPNEIDLTALSELDRGKAPSVLPGSTRRGPTQE